MATNNITLSGMGKWINILDQKFLPAKRKMNLYLDDKSLEVFKESGLKLKFKEDEDGKYITLSRKDEDGAPFVFMKGKKTPFEGKVGNGSIVTVKVEIYDTKSFGKGHRLEAIRVDELVEYIAPEGGEKTVRKAMPF